VNLDAARAFSTFAYPTTVTDADGFSSSVWYNYDFSAQTRMQGPPPQGQQNGIIQKFSYDETTRLKQATTTNTGAYVHYDYGPDYTSSFASVNNVAANYWESDTYTNRFFDGLGRVFAVASNHPGSTGGNKGQYTRYDQMGRAVQQTNPFEMDSGWNTTGDDAAGYQFNVANTFDWKGRPLRTYNMDGTFKEASYDGCGCAGGEVVTLTDEMSRQQKTYSDVLGRQWKTEVLNSNSSAYSTSETTLNARDQATLVRQFQGDDQSGVHQDTTMNYDGYGRLQTKHAPEQSTGANTIYAYNSDDTIQSVTDARGASATYGYNNNRGLVTSISYGAPYGVAATAAVGFGYDGAGNRTSMSDGLGSVVYNYDSLSRLTSESRTFNGVGTYALNYQYNLANDLTSIADPFGATLYYGFDSTGRLNSVTGSGYSAVTQFASNMQYRAWGGLKAVTYDGTRSLAISHNSRMNPNSFRIVGQNYTAGSEYQYYADGEISYSHDLTDNRFDRSYSYDHVARLTSSFTGSEARGGNVADGPYRQTYGYDSWGNLNQRTGRDWSHNSAPVSFNYDSSTNRNSQWQYDAEGNVVGQGTSHYSYDANGQQVGTSQTGGSTASQAFDGDGFQVRNSYPGWVGYTLRSSALNGAVVAELNGQGQAWRSFIYANGQVLAEQDDVYPQVVWKHRSPSNNSEFVSLTSSTGASRLHEYDPMGTEFGDDDPYLNGGNGDYGDWTRGQGVPSDLTTGCSWEGMPIGCEFALKFTNWRGYTSGGLRITSRTIPGVGISSSQLTHVKSTVIGYVDGSGEWSDGDIGIYKNLISKPDSYQTSIVRTQDATRKNTALQLRDSNPDCSIRVRYLGPETVHHANGIDEFGAAFIASGTVRSSKIGRVGDPGAVPDVLSEVKGDFHNGGQWTVGQSITPLDSNSTWSNGNTAPGNPQSPLGKTTDDSPRPYSRRITARNFWWSDSPGFYSFPDQRLLSGNFSANITIYATNGEGKQCWVAFNIGGTFANGRWTTFIGPPR